MPDVNRLGNQAAIYAAALDKGFTAGSIWNDAR
jgi:membrane carboxypeptidase/penicillin-binding protein